MGTWSMVIGALICCTLLFISEMAQCEMTVQGVLSLHDFGLLQDKYMIILRLYVDLPRLVEPIIRLISPLLGLSIAQHAKNHALRNTVDVVITRTAC